MININDLNKLIEKEKITQIFLDFDECVVDSINSVLFQLNKRYNTNFNMHDIHKWNMKDCFPNMTSIEIEEIFDSQEFFNELKWKDGALNFVSKYHDKITIITRGNSLNLYLKEIWLREYFPEIKFIGLEGIIMDKSSVQMGSDTMHIDDSQDNLKSTDAEYKVLFENVKGADWNNKWDIVPDEYELLVSPYSHNCKIYCEKKYTINSWK